MTQSVGDRWLAAGKHAISAMLLLLTLTSCSREQPVALRTTNDEQTAGATVASERSIGPQLPSVDVSIFDVGNGLHFRRGQSLDEFRKQHPRSRCFDSATLGPTAEVSCEILSPDAEDCPSTEGCEQVTYTFDAQRLDGFMTFLPVTAWRKISAASSKMYGHPQHRNGRVASMLTETSTWKLPNGDFLGLSHSSGSDINGNPIAHGFGVIYGKNEE